MRVATYRRVSSERQAEEGYSLEAQQALLLDFAARQGWRVVTDYCDAGLSGSRTDRPALQALLRDQVLAQLRARFPSREEVDRRLPPLQARLADLERRLKRYTEAFEREILDPEDFAARLAALREERTRLIEEIATLERSRPPDLLPAAERPLRIVLDARRAWQGLALPARRAVLRAACSQVSVGPGPTVSLAWRI